MERLVSLFGLFAIIGMAWLMSLHRRRVSWRIVLGGLTLQFAFAFLLLGTPPGEWLFIWRASVCVQCLVGRWLVA